MIVGRRAVLVLLVLIPAALVAVGSALYLGNKAPVVPRLSADEMGSAPRPFVIKLHAQWCAVCMVTKGVWSRIEETYAGRVHLLVLDFTNEANATASRAEALRLGLDKFFDEFSGVTGTVVILDGRTRDVRAALNGNRNFADYQAAIDAALREATGS